MKSTSLECATTNVTQSLGRRELNPLNLPHVLQVNHDDENDDNSHDDDDDDSDDDDDDDSDAAALLIKMFVKTRSLGLRELNPLNLQHVLQVDHDDGCDDYDDDELLMRIIDV